MNEAFLKLAQAIDQHGQFINNHTARITTLDHIVAFLVGWNIALTALVLFMLWRRKKPQVWGIAQRPDFRTAQKFPPS